MSIIKYLTNVFNYGEIQILKSKIKELEDKIILIEDYHIKEISLKNKEIELLNKQIDQETSTPKKNLSEINFSITEKRVITLHSQHQCKNYEELQKVTNKNKVHLRNIISKLKKKGYFFEWYI